MRERIERLKAREKNVQVEIAQFN